MMSFSFGFFIFNLEQNLNFFSRLVQRFPQFRYSSIASLKLSLLAGSVRSDSTNLSTLAFAHALLHFQLAFRENLYTHNFKGKVFSIDGFIF